VPTQRLVENYIYGQLHFDDLDREGADPFTSSREGVVEDDARFQAFLDYLRRELLPKIIDDWDRLRLKHRKPGDEENKRRTKKERRAADFVEAAEDEFRGSDSEENDKSPEDPVDQWLGELRPDAEFNVSAYVDCFLSENLVRKYIAENSLQLTKPAQTEVDDWKKRETDRKAEANINFEIRQGASDLSYLDMNMLAICAEGSKSADGKPTPLVLAGISFRPVRNAVGHTGLLTDTAKKHLSVTFENIKGRVKILLKGETP
jgi:hypothetical protein